MSRYPEYLSVSLLILVLATGCAGGKHGQETSGRARVNLLAGPYLSFAPFFIGFEEGLFAAQGFDLQFVRREQPSIEMSALLDRGEVDISAGFVDAAVLNAIARGVRIRIVADKGHIDASGCTFGAILARNGLSIDRPPAGGTRPKWRIALGMTGPEALYVERALAARGMRLDDMTTRRLADNVIVEALANGSIDLAPTTEPWVTRVLKSGKATVWQPFQQIMPGAQHAVVFFGRTFLDADPGAGSRFMLAYLQAVRRYNRGKTPRNLDILARHTRLDRSIVEAACWVPIRDDGAVNLDSIAEFERWSVGRKLLDAPLPSGTLWDGRFVDYANGALRADTRQGNQ